MDREVASLSLIEQLSEPGFSSSVIATYACYFPFWEDVVLRRLMAAGCTHNVLMVDSKMCAEAFASEELRPHRAGRDYTLIPVRVGGAFHPKMFLRLGKSKGSLFVGSHNLTLAGFGLNDEVTNAFRVEGSAIRNGGGPLREAFEYLARFVPMGLPDVVEAYQGLKLGVPWLDGPLGVGDPDRTLLTSWSGGPDLWSQVASFIPGRVSTAFVCGPFFDPKLALVQRLQQDLRLRELVIGIDPASVQIDPREAALLSGVRWVNVAGVPAIRHRRAGSSHYLHAKLFWLAGESGELLIAGSANPSVAAFLAPASARNAEAIVADRRVGAGTTIGIGALLDAPPIEAADWTAVADRRAAVPSLGREPGRRAWVATPIPEGFRTQEALSPGIVLHGIGDNGRLLGDAVVRTAGTTIEASDIVRDGARYLEVTTPEHQLLVIVHRTDDVAKNLGGDTRKALRQALGALEEDPGQLDTLLKLTEKVIFDSEDVVRPTPMRPVGAPGLPKEDAGEVTSLALDAAGRKSRRQRRSLASGDIVVLLDALLRRLGEGLPVAAYPRPGTDEAEIGSDEEDGGELAHKAPDFEILAKACRSKIRRLIKRMEGQFELASAPDRARRGVVQLAAVLGVIRAVRIIGLRPEWRARRLDLVDRDDEWRLFEAAVRAVIWHEDGLAPRAITEADGEWFDELSFLVGLLVWLAWDVEVDAEEASKRGGLQGVEDESWYPVQLLAAIGPWFFDDEAAASVLEESVTRTPRQHVDGDWWLHAHRGLMDGFARVAADPDHQGQMGRLAHPGDLVVLGGRELPRVRLVLDVRPGTDGAKVVFFDPAGILERRAFLSSRVPSLPWIRREASSAASA